MSVLVVGGAGYIGSHMVRALEETNRRCAVLDDLSTGHRDAVGGNFFKGRIDDRDSVGHALAASGTSAVMHFGSFIQVGESVKSPAKYYDNNVAGTIGLLNALCERGSGASSFPRARPSTANPLPPRFPNPTVPSPSTPMDAASSWSNSSCPITSERTA